MFVLNAYQTDDAVALALGELAGVEDVAGFWWCHT